MRLHIGPELRSSRLVKSAGDDAISSAEGNNNNTQNDRLFMPEFGSSERQSASGLVGQATAAENRRQGR